ncbi:hypothetical protein [Helicobacter sp. L8]|uniref:hypothetical protein n=1 Tax=Helicobacter sp. L8 TaxID=2316078 RepID=UPI000EB00DE9|nr:hypothetical protein [Helicobacter sp. L8]
MEHLPNMDQYQDPLKIIFVNGDVWEGVKTDYICYAPPDLLEDEQDEEDELMVTYKGVAYTLRASEIKEIIGAHPARPMLKE